MKNYKVLVCEPIHPAALEKIKEFADILPSYDQLGEADAIVNRNLSLTREELQKAKFEQKVDDKDYKMFDCERRIPKSQVTKDKKDQFTITKSMVKATHIYNVANQVGIHTTLEDKEEAIKLCDEINSQIYKVL